jgi:predicted methyltransferase
MPQPTSLVADAIASPDRFAGDIDEDAWRHPQAVLAFMGVEPGMNVLDYFAASGYYSELLSRSVGPAGSVIVYNNPTYAEFAGEKLAKRFENNRLGNAKVVTVPTSELKLEASSLDGVLFVMSYHDLYWTPKDAKAPLGDPAQVTASLFQALKPGGVVVVVDHAAKPGSDTLQVVDALHRIDPEAAKRDFAKAGFIFDGESKALEHLDDDRTKLVFDESVRHKTDQFILHFSKPKEL